MTTQSSPPLPPAPASPRPNGAPAPEQQIVGERHVSSVAGAGAFTKRQGVILIVCATGALLAFVLLRPPGSVLDPNRGDDRLRVRAQARYEPPPLPVTPVAIIPPRPLVTPPVAPTQQAIVPPVIQQTAPDPLAHARRAPLLAYGANSSGPAGSRQGQEGEGAGGGPARVAVVQPGNELSARLLATPVSAVGASVLPHQPYLLTKGNTLPCVLQTAMDSTLPGFVTCKLPQDVIGKTGITLLDRGTLVVGETHGGMQQGQNRLFVLWTRAETPNGVIINLDSPAADPLGRTGFDGVVENHFWARLGGALLLSVVQGGLQEAASAGTGGTTFNTGGVQGLSAETLRNSVDIRPTLRKNQGELVSIFVARDLDFSTVYKVSTVASTGAAGVAGARGSASDGTGTTGTGAFR